MQLNKINKIKDDANIIILGRSDTDFSNYLNEDSEIKYVRERVKSEKQITVLNQYKRTLFILALKDDKKEISQNLEEARKAANSLHQILVDLDIKAISIHDAGLTPKHMLAFTEGLALSYYRFSKYFTKQEKKETLLESVSILSDGVSDKDLVKLDAVIAAVSFTRNLVNEPLSYLTAEKLAEEISMAGEETGFTTEVFNKKKIESLRMGGLLAVNKGSIDPPTFSILEWKPEKAMNKKPYVLVGKGVVYDTGGLSLKPTHDSMDYMKCDMGGAAAVAGTFHALAKAKLPVWVIGLVPATDNRPDGNAYVPGDVIEMHNGSTVEVLNTDAEGRMILADALSYAKQYDPELVIDLATLTGAAHYAIGTYGIVGMGNASDEVMQSLKESGNNTFERIAEFPFWEDYAELLKSDIADMKNIGGGIAGAITAGKFLEKFTDYPYIHLDIAGPAYNKKAYNYRGKGGSGVGVRLLFDFFDQLTR